MTRAEETSMVIEPKCCPACHHEGASIFIEIEDVPIHCNLLWPSQKAALNAPKGDIRLGFCQACGMIYNLSFDPQRMKYTQAYENSLHFSPRFQAYAQELAIRLLETHHLRGKNIIEIGCGKGEFLSLLCAGGQNRGLGFDPSYDSRREDSRGNENMTFIRDFYSETYAEYKADFICCKQVLEHIQYPHDFLSQLRRSVGDRQDTIVFFEVPNVLYTLRDFGIWDILYEHCSYFSASSLSRVFQGSGFTVRQVYSTFGGQFLCLEASLAVAASCDNMEPSDELRQLASFVSAFAENYCNKVAMWDENLSQLLAKDSRIIVWGAGSKGVMFLNTVKNIRQIEYIVDINPHKQGRYIAGTGQQIVPPEFLREYQPNTVLVMNPAYKDEVQEKIAQLDLRARVATV
jgi:SAM-dependent methyltransferase